ncbi:methyltransferase-like protein 25B isoform X2 [Nematostella vectensis]|uniref:methyltransferase-like protein 25B isoform X2 n=1 Tax=Nematostella vectensis TaxID=45351 RepID=UPI00207776BB|nr:methyltransferase-like protein 25B isoform X2 [Nematostella vectensis]
MPVDEKVLLRQHTSRLATFVSNYKWLTEVNMREYFCNDVWNKVPFFWRQHFSDIRPEDLATVLLNKCGKDTKFVPRNYRHVWSLSLLSFVQACHSLSLPRSPVFESCRAGPCCQPRMRNEASLKHLRSQVKSKKLHEITKLAWVVKEMSIKQSCAHVVDVGAGLGHLSRVMAMEYGLRVVSLEADGCHKGEAERLDRKAEASKKKQTQTIGSETLPQHVTFKITQDITTEEFLDVLTRCFAGDDSPKCPDFILVGLHPCGDLVPTMLRVFAKCDQAVGLVMASCCYHKMDVKPCHNYSSSERAIHCYKGEETVSSQDIPSHNHPSSESAIHCYKKRGNYCQDIPSHSNTSSDSCKKRENSCQDVPSYSNTSSDSAIHCYKEKEAISSQDMSSHNTSSSDNLEHCNKKVGDYTKDKLHPSFTSYDNERHCYGKGVSSCKEKLNHNCPRNEGITNCYKDEASFYQDKPHQNCFESFSHCRQIRASSYQKKVLKNSAEYYLETQNVDEKGRNPSMKEKTQKKSACGEKFLESSKKCWEDLSEDLGEEIRTCNKSLEAKHYYEKHTCDGENSGRSPNPMCITKTSIDHVSGFPLSDWLGACYLGYTTRELACHNLEQYVDKLKANSPRLKHHCYRAILELIIMRQRADWDRSAVRLRGKRTAEGVDGITFRAYAEPLLRKIGIDVKSVNIESLEFFSLETRWREVMAFYCLRLLFAPVIESLILLDRLVYLHERGINGSVSAVFEPRISPRNLAITARKTLRNNAAEI